VSAEMDVVERLIAAFNGRDVDAVMDLFAPDAVYHNMPATPVQGPAAIRRLVESFVKPAERIDWRILNMAQNGPTVLTERLDRFIIQGKTVDLPVMGAFDIHDNKIAAWRDYFDFPTWQRQTASPPKA
jgi:limonene-1,2-epoxide hydrolase